MSKMKKAAGPNPETAMAAQTLSSELAVDIRGLIEAARLRVAQPSMPSWSC